MTLPYNTQGEDSLTTSTRVELFDANGHIDGAASVAATREVHADSNTVRLPGSSAIDVPNTQAKRALAKAAVLARRT